MSSSIAGKWYLILGMQMMWHVSLLYAQSAFTGTVKDAQTHLALYPATVQNRTAGVYALTNPDGSFAVVARPGDTIWIAFLGYETDTLVMTQNIAHHPVEIDLKPMTHSLQPVVVHGGLNPYQMDSIQRMQLFGAYLSRARQPLAGTYTPSGFGIVLSPFTYFSHKQRNLRKFRRMFEAYERAEREKYYQNLKLQLLADKYNPQRIMEITGLRGDSLQAFLHTMQPDTSFLLQAPQDAVDMYIRQQYQKFLHQKKSNR
ncbi:peptidase associated/transthyretin-like domain-containing protein [Thermoflavifilum thermophilum]|uniref:CarboxypepD_reg-like domain-containing protein n=1 Tax=Thermoflavifilum thermophilum TaxID=1393122 RepID=A0A1I7N2R3_9BACT|nr:carboxypeptidase-like regulatory domain-containing protein [Thermoflavifilum thermophilum]SFV28905.1 CarboxypepD_reg-like domain-containing protein [Thermoflavifilum thermophilum]